ncbi:MAG: radical SAM protein, partial [Clostridia bacterium]
MKITLVCLNSKFTHTSLGIWYIKQYCQSSKVDFSMLDTFVNRSTAEIVADILKTNPDIVGFSTYIFNVEKTVEVATEIKARGIRTVFGGPEATFNTKIHDLADQIILGEGERAWESIINGNNSHIIAGEETQNIAYPYTDEFFENAKNRMVYFEASRGCPFSCSYCMSAGTKLRQFPFEEVTRELLKFKNKDIRLIKFVDRTFNANKRYAERLLNWINENFSNDKIRFHFEVAPELFDEGLLNAIKNAKKGLFQFEIGYQSYSKKALEAVNRFENLEISASNIKKLVSFNNSHIHTDLIVGLPYEDMLSFKQSFNELYSLGGHQIQVGFLKVLKGSKLENELADGYVVNETPPYEVTETP